MVIKRSADIKASEITKESDYLGRRKFLTAAGIATVGLVGSGRLLSAIAPSIDWVCRLVGMKPPPMPWIGCGPGWPPPITGDSVGSTA